MTNYRKSIPVPIIARSRKPELVKKSTQAERRELYDAERRKAIGLRHYNDADFARLLIRIDKLENNIADLNSQVNNLNQAYDRLARPAANNEVSKRIFEVETALNHLVGQLVMARKMNDKT